MLDIPFPLETVPSDRAGTALETLRRQRPGVTPVLLGDADVFSTEWAEVVDIFEPPDEILAEAREIDIDAWFENRRADMAAADAGMGRSLRVFNGAYRVAAFPFDVALFPFRLIRWPFTGRRPGFLSRSPFDHGAVRNSVSGVDALKSQLSELEAAGEGSDEELADIRAIIAGLEAGDHVTPFPDPVDYVTPRRGSEMAAGLLEASLPWESTAWLQHGTYALCAPKPVFVAHCRWMWDTFGAGPITASTDHIGFQVDRPIATPEDAREVLRRFALLGATEINGDRHGSDGYSLVGAPRLWVWWD